MTLKNIFLSFIAAAAICNPLAAMYRRPSYAPAIICFVGATASGITAWWAHKKVKSLSTLSDEEKNKPEIKEKIRWYCIMRNTCIAIGSYAMLSGCAVTLLIYKVRKQEQPDPKLVRAAQKANYECGICYEKINDSWQYAVGSSSESCEHFFCRGCIQEWHTTCRRDYYYHGIPHCPICRRR